MGSLTPKPNSYGSRLIQFDPCYFLTMFFRAKEDSSYAGYHLSYEVKKLMYDIVAFLCFVVRTVNTFVSIEI